MAMNTLSAPAASYSAMAGSEQRLQGVAAAVDGAESGGSDWLWSQLAEQVEVAAEADTETLAPEGSPDGVRLPALTTPPEAESEKGPHDAAPAEQAATDRDGDALADEAGLLLSWQPVLLPQLRTAATLGGGQLAEKNADAARTLAALSHLDSASAAAALPTTKAVLDNQLAAGAATLTAVESPRMPAPLTASESSRHEALLAAVPVIAASAPQSTAPSRAEWSPVALPMDQTAQWGQQLVDTLKERVEMQVNQQVKQAHIRLDPPELGKLDLTVRVEGERVTVQLNAAHPAVREALIQSTERLRMALAPHHSGGVDVNVGQGERQGREALPWQEEAVLTGRRSRQAAAEEEQASSGYWQRLDTRV